MNWAQWVITAGAVTGAVSVMFHTLVRPVLRWARRIENAVTIVEANMFKNGGSSLRDAVNRIEERITVVEAYITKPD